MHCLTCGNLNPLDLRDDASSEHYVKTLDILLHSQDFDALMVIHSPSAAAPATESAQELIEAVKHHPRSNVLSRRTGAASTPRKRHDVYSAKPGCRPIARRKAPSPRLCIWWSTGVPRATTRNAGVAQQSDFQYRRSASSVATGDCRRGYVARYP
ncbi:hypothetical protein ACLB1M_20430 [Escherichia coli]